MPWDGTELWVADVGAAGDIETPRRVAGGPQESIFQPGWSPDGLLYFVSDRTGWWNLYRSVDDRVEPVHPMEAEFGRPQWSLGASTWAFADRRCLVAACVEKGRWRLVTIDVESGVMVPVTPVLEPADTVAATRGHAVLVAGSAQSPDAVVRIELSTGKIETIRAASTTEWPAGLVSVPDALEFPTERGLTAHAFYYPPRNLRFAPPVGDLPPLIVIGHGGPTSATTLRMNLEIQYWTTRGYAVADVNYGGSTGYGRSYRERLKGQWGVVDVADCVNAARYLVSQRKVDPDRLIIRGRSAGGYTTLAALTFRPDVFRAGASYYGISDLELLTRDTHKFESKYLEGLVGPYPAMRERYRSRSPIDAVENLSCPIIFFQGLDDRVVPPAQAQRMSDAVRAKGLPTKLLLFEGEQHGFRKAETIAACLEAERRFYEEVFVMKPTGAGSAPLNGDVDQ
jgi:dipeptidyl aminopeptidase/acylaminoacyl peptidase